MDYKENLYPKMPFYMTYPVQNMYLTEMEYEKDMDRMKSFYPKETKAVMELVEKRFDELEYEGSRIYDEEPDRLMIQMEIDGIYKKLKENPDIMGKSVEAVKVDAVKMDTKPSYFDMVPMSLSSGKNLQAQDRGRDRDRDRDRGRGRDCENDWLCSMTGVLFGNELYKRRCRYRRCRRWF